MRFFDVTIVGGGILGLGTALAVTARSPRTRLLLLEKETQIASHQTGHNSGVIHSGIYYRPGTLKASLCVSGARAMLEFCRRNQIPFQRCGKVVVAASKEHLPRLEELHRRGTANGVAGLSLIGPERLRELEPHARGIRALHVPDAGIVDYRQVAQAFRRIVESRGGSLLTGTPVTRIQPKENVIRLTLREEAFESRFLINCGGLQADLLARKSGAPVDLQIVPFRGEYFELVPERRSLVRSLIYPVPDPRFPFLGVHLSRRVDGRVEAGPNAVLALKREGYRKNDLNLADLGRMLSFPGFWKFGLRHWRTGLAEGIRSLNKGLFVRSLQELVPGIRPEDLVPAPSGVRAQAMDRAGKLLDDFHLVRSGRCLHVCNAPSPAATASIRIGERIADEALRYFDLPA